MKSSAIKALLLLPCLLLLFSSTAAGALKPSGGDSNATLGPDAQLGRLFSVAYAKEPIYLILVEKNLQRLRVLEYDDKLKIVAEYPSATGENFGIKEVSGDAKTPEGIYFITQIFRDDEITIFGDKAFHLDYPNFFDKAAGRNGDGIYIHGTNKELVPNSTNGCVTLANNDLDDLETYLNQVVTPVLIVPELGTADSVTTALLTDNDYSLVKSLLLAEEIKPENVEYNYLYVIKYGKQTVAVSDFIYRPFRRTIMRGASRAYLEYNLDSGWETQKRIWRVSPMQIYPEAPVKVAAHPLTSGEIQLAEQTPEEAQAMITALRSQDRTSRHDTPQKQQKAAPAAAATRQVATQKPSARETPPTPQNAPRTQAPVPAATAAPSSPRISVAKKIAQQQKIMADAPLIPPPDKVVPTDKQQILDFVEQWRQAWISQEIDPYIAFYDSTFKSGDKDLAQWKAHKANLNKTYAFIKVEISDIKVNWTAEGATVSFRQEYRSDRYSATGSKTLFLVFNDPGWKIKREVYSRI